MIVLTFSDPLTPQLHGTFFQHPLAPKRLVCVRGPIGAAYAAGTFPWTKAVKALCILLLRTAAARDSRVSSGNPLVALTGASRSAAAALDSALAKQPQWLLEMFGVTERGASIGRRLFYRINPERKRPGPVLVSVNHKALPAANIKVFVQRTEIVDSETLLAIARRIQESTWQECEDRSLPASLDLLLGIQTEPLRECA